jgi:hypothetical protein
VATIGLFVVQFPFSLEAQQNRSPVFDVHLHGSFTKANTDAMQAMMDSLNVTGAMFIGSYEQITSLPGRRIETLIPGLMFPCEGGKMPNAGVPCFPGTGEFPDTAWLRKEVIAGRIKVFGEISAEYLGMLPDDPKLEPYYALAEELDVPVGIHPAA